MKDDMIVSEAMKMRPTFRYLFLVTPNKKALMLTTVPSLLVG